MSFERNRVLSKKIRADKPVTAGTILDSLASHGVIKLILGRSIETRDGPHLEISFHCRSGSIIEQVVPVIQD